MRNKYNVFYSGKFLNFSIRKGRKMKLNKSIIKSNKGFTLQDLSIAIMIFIIFAGTIGGTYVTIYKTQSDTKIDVVATLFSVQIMEYIDKVGYDEITTSNTQTFIDESRTKFSIPSTFQIGIEVIPSTNTQDLVKKVKLTLNYTFSGDERSIVIERLKVKEL